MVSNDVLARMCNTQCPPTGDEEESESESALRVSERPGRATLGEFQELQAAEALSRNEILCL